MHRTLAIYTRLNSLVQAKRTGCSLSPCNGSKKWEMWGLCCARNICTGILSGIPFRLLVEMKVFFFSFQSFTDRLYVFSLALRDCSASKFVELPFNSSVR